MDCRHYEEHELGQLDAQAFAAHAESCPTCQRLLASDRQLLAAARQLREPVDTGALWPQLRRRLEQEMSPQPSRRWRLVGGWAWKAAAVVTLAAAGTLLWSQRPRPEPGRLLNASALERVEAAEREYEAAIARLEEESLETMPLDPEVRALLDEKLAIIDMQIGECRRAARHNPGNAHVRHYLLAALQAKRAALEELAEPENGSG